MAGDRFVGLGEAKTMSDADGSGNAVTSEEPMFYF
jgi:hypothetical protein